MSNFISVFNCNIKLVCLSVPYIWSFISCIWLLFINLRYAWHISVLDMGSTNWNIICAFCCNTNPSFDQEVSSCTFLLIRQEFVSTVTKWPYLETSCLELGKRGSLYVYIYNHKMKLTLQQNTSPQGNYGWDSYWKFEKYTIEYRVGIVSPTLQGCCGMVCGVSNLPIRHT